MKNVDHTVIGKTRSDTCYVVHGLDGKVVIDASVEELREAWRSPLEG
jgi:hypothetical protein